MNTPTTCTRCGEAFTETRPAMGGFLNEWFCGPCIAVGHRTPLRG